MLIKILKVFSYYLVLFFKDCKRSSPVLFIGFFSSCSILCLVSSISCLNLSKLDLDLLASDSAFFVSASNLIFSCLSLSPSFWRVSNLHFHLFISKSVSFFLFSNSVNSFSSCLTLSFDALSPPINHLYPKNIATINNTSIIVFLMLNMEKKNTKKLSKED